MPTQTKPYNIPPLERRDIQVQTGYTRRRVTNSRFQFLETQEEYFQVLHGDMVKFNAYLVLWTVVRFESATQNPCSAVVAICEGISPLGYR